MFPKSSARTEVNTISTFLMVKGGRLLSRYEIPTGEEGSVLVLHLIQRAGRT